MTRSSRSIRRRAGLLGMALAMLTAGCQTTPTPATDDPTAPSVASPSETAPAPGTQTGMADPDDIDPARLAPLAGMAPCPESPEAPALDVDLTHVALPPEAVVTTASDDGPLTSAQGYSPRTPVELMVSYMRLEDWTILNAEDEVFESEMLVERDGLRVFVKAQATCARGSAFVLFASSDEALVPTPAGAP